MLTEERNKPHILIMATGRDSAVKRKLFIYDENSDSSDISRETDDSVRDKDYFNSSSSSDDSSVVTSEVNRI